MQLNTLPPSCTLTPLSLLLSENTLHTFMFKYLLITHTPKSARSFLGTQNAMDPEHRLRDPA